jgi:membrane protease YdiL (CAAX protease family)
LLVVPIVLVFSSGDAVVDEGWLSSPPFDAPAAISALALVGAALSGYALFRAELVVAGLVARARESRPVLGHPAVDGATGSFGEARTGVAGFVVVGAVMGAVEELLWRGYFITGAELLWGWPTAAAVIAGALSFGINHYFFGLRNVFLKGFEGVVWGAMFVASGSLWLPIASHTTFNVFVGRRLGASR